jgi:hypothetical protein|eukprot:SAG25_NODE_273_length_10590_cov_137.207968_4_plen_45_part_00
MAQRDAQTNLLWHEVNLLTAELERTEGTLETALRTNRECAGHCL